MKKIIAIICMAALCVQADVSQKDKAKWRLSVRTSTSRAISETENLSEMSVEEKAVLANYLKTEMLNNVTGYKNREEASKQLYSKVEQKKFAEYDQALERLAKQATETSPITVTVDDIKKMGGEALTEAKQSESKSFMDENYETLFSISREEAITAQKKDISKIAIFPTYEILNDFFNTHVKIQPLAMDNKLKQQLNEIVLKEGESSKAVFDELVGYVKQQNSVVNSEIDYQLGFRKNSIEDALNEAKGIANLYEQTLISNYVSNKVAKVVEDNYKDADATIPKYKLFSLNLGYIQKKSAELEQQKLIDFVKSSDSKITNEDIIAKIKADISKHKKSSESKVILTNTYLTELPLVLDKQYVTYVGTQNAGEFFVAELAKKQKPYETLQAKVDQQLKVALPSARFLIVDEQMLNYFPRALDETNFAEEDIIEYYKSQSLGIEQLKDVYVFYDIPENKANEITPVLLEETEKKIISITKTRLNEQLDSLKIQLSILYKLENEQKDLLKESIREGKTKDELFNSWMQKIKADYLTNHADVAKKYPEIYQYVQDELKKIISQYFDAIREEQKQQEQQPVVAPQVSSDQSTSEEAEEIIEEVEPEEEEVEKQEEKKEIPAPVKEEKGVTDNMKEILGTADCLLVFSDLDDGNSKVVFLLPTEGLVVEKIFDPSDIEVAAEEIGNAIGGYLKTIVNEKTSENSSLFGFGNSDEKTIKVFVLIRSNQTRHKMTVILRKNMIGQIQSITNGKKQKLKIHWEEAL
ncbi:MAG: hypothetical protein PF692_15310 [Kiritimatiellae bacterium]|nr:hypothetical protein [Kiritimatiellia bacterium]